MVKVRRIGSAARRMIPHHKTQQNTARIARTAGNTAICGDIVRAVLTAIITRAGSLPTALVSTDRVEICCLVGLSGSI
jgi:hypothetical protein